MSIEITVTVESVYLTICVIFVVTTTSIKQNMFLL